jgi:hypothetical protein
MIYDEDMNGLLAEGITLDYLEFFCQQNQILVGCLHADQELWISGLGPHPSHLTADQVEMIIKEASWFKVRRVSAVPSEAPISLVSRRELEESLRRIVN